MKIRRAPYFRNVAQKRLSPHERQKGSGDRALEAAEPSDLRVFAKVVSGYVGAATSALRDRDFDAGLTFIDRALRACEAAPSRALVSQELATLEALAIAAVKRVPVDREAWQAAPPPVVTVAGKLSDWEKTNIEIFRAGHRRSCPSRRNSCARTP